MKIKNKKLRKKAIRKADLKALKGYDAVKNHPSNHIGEYTITRGGIASKIKAEETLKKIPYGTSVAEKLFGQYVGGKIKK